nr:unnamed protein product [Spirometra erinaceieuropaei]
MRSLLGDMQINEKLVNEMFLEHLPADVQTTLASGSQNLTVPQLAEMTDRIIEELLLKHPNIIKPQFRSSEGQHDVGQHIRTSGPPVFARPRGLAPASSQASKAEFEHMLLLGIIRPSESPWASPLHVVPKATSADSGHPCGDIPKTIVTTTFGLFGFIHMPFCLRYAAKTFQRFIDHVLRGLPFVYACIDDLLVTNQTAEEHKEHLALVFDHHDKFWVINNPSRVEASRDFPPPTSKRHLQRFLGMVIFYRRFLPKCAHLMLPLTSMLSGPKGLLELTGETLAAFGRIKSFLADATLLTHSAPEARLFLMVDASTVGVGAVLQQHLAGSTRIIEV